MSCSANNCIATPTLQCGRCKQVQYCGESCQRSHWDLEHRSVCQPIGDDANQTCKQTDETIARVQNKYFAGYGEREDRHGTSFMMIVMNNKVDLAMSDICENAANKSPQLRSSVMMTDVMTAVTYLRDEWQKLAQDADVPMPRFTIDALDRFSVGTKNGTICFYRFVWPRVVVWAQFI